MGFGNAERYAGDRKTPFAIIHQVAGHQIDPIGRGAEMLASLRDSRLAGAPWVMVVLPTIVSRSYQPESVCWYVVTVAVPPLTDTDLLTMFQATYSCDQHT